MSAGQSYTYPATRNDSLNHDRVFCITALLATLRSARVRTHPSRRITQFRTNFAKSTKQLDMKLDMLCSIVRKNNCWGTTASWSFDSKKGHKRLCEKVTDELRVLSYKYQSRTDSPSFRNDHVRTETCWVGPSEEEGRCTRNSHEMSAERRANHDFFFSRGII